MIFIEDSTKRCRDDTILSSQKTKKKIFSGPIQRQLTDALAFIRNYVIQEKVNKVSNRAEAIRIFNYPYRDKIISALSGMELTLTELARAMGYKGITAKLRSTVEFLLKSGKIQRKMTPEGNIQYFASSDSV